MKSLQHQAALTRRDDLLREAADWRLAKQADRARVTALEPARAAEESAYRRKRQTVMALRRLF
jgi:hypothetical protein